MQGAQLSARHQDHRLRLGGADARCRPQRRKGRSTPEKTQVIALGREQETQITHQAVVGPRRVEAGTRGRDDVGHRGWRDRRLLQSLTRCLGEQTRRLLRVDRVACAGRRCQQDRVRIRESSLETCGAARGQIADDGVTALDRRCVESGMNEPTGQAVVAWLPREEIAHLILPQRRRWNGSADRQDARGHASQ